MTPSVFWTADEPLVLASGSVTRRLLLESAGIPVEVVRAPVNESSIAATLLEQRETPAGIAIALAHAKAEAAARRWPERLLLAADQTLDHDGRLLMKPVDSEQARRQLLALRGQRHELHSAVVLRRGDEVLWSGIDSASLRMRTFSEAFLDLYLEATGDVITTTVGGYQLESLGVQLFESIRGEHSTILGLPLIPVLYALRDLNILVR